MLVQSIYLKKKEFIIDGQKQIYYKKIDAAYGFYYEFNNDGLRFIALTGKSAGKTIPYNSNLNDTKTSDFKSLNDLCDENNNKYNYYNLLKKYQCYIGYYYTYDSKKRTFYSIDDQNLLQKIQVTSKDYDDAILNNDTDISQMYSAIKETIVSQDEQIMQILTSLFKNQKVINSSLSLDMIANLKENIIVYGSTGTGKTEILKRIANIYNTYCY